MWVLLLVRLKCHPSPLRALLIKLVELLLQQQLELREIIDRE
jgi:hypothetical protein